MKPILAACAAASALFAGGAALAQGETHGPFYADIGYTHVTFLTEDMFGFDTVQHGLLSHVGWEPTRHFGAEAEIGLASHGVEETEGPLSAKVYTTMTLGLWGKGMLPVSDNVTLFARAGYAYVEAETEVEFMGVSSSGNEPYDGLGYGGGANIRFGDSRYGLRLEYTRYDLSEIEANAASIGLRRDF